MGPTETEKLFFWFSYIEPYRCLWNESNLDRVDGHFDVFLDLVHKYYCIYVYKKNLPVIVFFVEC